MSLLTSVLVSLSWEQVIRADVSAYGVDPSLTQECGIGHGRWRFVNPILPLVGEGLELIDVTTRVCLGV